MEPGRCESCPAKAGHQPEASLAWADLVRAPAKRRQRGRRPCDGASKGTCRRGRPRSVKGRQHSCVEMAWHKELDRGQRVRQTTIGVPPGTWETPPFPPKKVPVRVPADQRSRLAARGRPQAARAKPGGRTGGTTGTRATEPGRMDGGESESRIVPLKPGNRPEGPGGGKEAPGHGTEWGDRCRDRRISEASQRDFVG
jgi:hypothetical protein